MRNLSAILFFILFMTCKKEPHYNYELLTGPVNIDFTQELWHDKMRIRLDFTGECPSPGYVETNYSIQGSVFEIYVGAVRYESSHENETYYRQISIPPINSGTYCFILRRDNRSDSATLIVSDSEIVFKPYHHPDLSTSHEVLKRKPADLIWYEYNYEDKLNNADLTKVIDSGYVANGAVAYTPSPGYYQYFIVDSNHQVVSVNSYSGMVSRPKTFLYTGDFTGLATFHKYFNSEYWWQKAYLISKDHKGKEID